MKKNKKLKSQFKKLLNEQIHKAIKENPDFKSEKEENNKSPEASYSDAGNNIQSSYAWHDIYKTMIISAFIIGVMIALAFVLNKYGLFGKATDLILKIIGAK